MTSFSYMILATEIFSIIICGVLQYANLFESHGRTQRGNIFTLMVATNILALAADAVSWIFEGHAECTWLLNTVTILAIMLSLALVIEFAVYITTLIGERRAISVPVYYAALIALGVASLATLAACFLGQIFYYDNGVYTTGPMYSIYIIVNFLSLIVCMAVVTYYRKDLGLHDCIVAYIYIAIPAISAALSGIIDGWDFAYPACTLSLLLLYVTIQSEQADRLEQEKQSSQYYATHDELTGLQNRRAYMDRVGMQLQAKGKIGVIFCDVNGLKFTNDHYGHEAGDKLLIFFAHLLREHFPGEDIFRISGDEFTVLVPNSNTDTFDSMVRKLESDLFVDGQFVACIGADYGVGKDIHTLARSAEARMYKRKEIFHSSRPDLAR